MIQKHIEFIDSLRKEVRRDVMKSKGKEAQSLTYIFTVLTSLVDKFKEDEEDIKLIDGTERYHR